MKVLVLGSRIPYPLKDGGAKASYQLLETLNTLGYDVTFFSFNTKKHFASEAVIKEHLGFCRVITSYLDGGIKPISALLNLLRGKSYNLSRFNNKKAKTQLSKLLSAETFDVVHFESLFTIPFWNIVKLNHKGPTILRQHNVEYKIWERLANESQGLKKRYLSILAKQLKREEEKALPYFDAVVGISQEDTDYFKRLNNNAEYISVASEAYEPISALEKNCFCHIGSMEWQPNVQAVLWFLEQVWPTFIKQYPKAKFHLAGKGLSQKDSRFDVEQVVNHGEVHSAQEFLRSKGTLIIPLQSASGVRIKAIEAMSLAVPVISTKIGVSGLNVQNNKQVLLANSKEEMLKCMKHALQSPQELKTIGMEGWNYVQDTFSKQALSKKWKDFYSGIVQI